MHRKDAPNEPGNRPQRLAGVGDRRSSAESRHGSASVGDDADAPDRHPYADLTPDVILAAVEARGIACDGTILALNSYENRVYQLGTEQGYRVVKFYRPQRWSSDAILEEHAFALELSGHDIPVVAPLVIDGKSLHEHAGHRFAVYVRRGGRWPELGTADERVWMGRFLARIHAIGALQRFRARSSLSPLELGTQAVEELLAGDWIPAHLVDGYARITEQLLEAVEDCFRSVGAYRELRIHGDCHPGNVLWTDDGPHFVDLDDCVNGPAVQDLWLFLSGTREEMTVQLADLLEGYGQFFDFDPRELRLIEALRASRIMNYAAWITRRWSDPAFPRAFPWITETKYWEEHVLTLKEQRAALDEPSLAIHI